MSPFLSPSPRDREHEVEAFEQSLRGRTPKRSARLTTFVLGLSCCAMAALGAERARAPAREPFARDEQHRTAAPPRGPLAGAHDEPHAPAHTAGDEATRAATPASEAAARVVRVLDRVRSNLRTTAYRHDLRVDERAGLYQWDCSLMASWVLARAAPRARAALSGGSRPLAVDFYRTIRAAPAVGSLERAPADAGDAARPRARRRSSSAPWAHVTRIEDARPGDLLAWQRPRWFRSNNTGHVAIVLEPPTRYTENAVLVRIADASSYNHENDSRAGGTGYGEGTILLALDERTGGSVGYGWYGRAALAWIVPTEVVIGRPMR